MARVQGYLILATVFVPVDKRNPKDMIEKSEAVLKAQESGDLSALKGGIALRFKAAFSSKNEADLEALRNVVDPLAEEDEEDEPTSAPSEGQDPPGAEAKPWSPDLRDAPENQELEPAGAGEQDPEAFYRPPYAREPVPTTTRRRRTTKELP